MIKVYNNIIPFKGYLAMTVWPFLFIKSKYRYQFNAYDENHENIHGRQQFEVLVVAVALALMLILSLDLSWWWMLTPLAVFYIWYGIEYVIRLFLYGNHKEAYRNISFEQEAFMYEKDFGYLAKDRKPFACVKYLTRKTYRR